MSRDLRSDETFDRLINAWLDERAHAGDADAVLDAALARTSRTHPLAAWRLPERWIPGQLTMRLQPLPRLVPILFLVGLLLVVAVAIVVVGSQRRVPPPFGLAAPGDVAFVSDGHLWRANPDGSGRVQVTSDPRIDGFPTFSRDGTKIAFKRFLVANSIPNWQEWGDVMVADADGGHPIVIDANVHSPSPISWSPDRRFIVYSRSVGDVDQVFIAAVDDSMRQQVTRGAQSSWGPTLSPDGRTIAFIRSAGAEVDSSIVGLYVIQIDGTGERQITTGSMYAFDSAEWSPDATTLLFSADIQSATVDTDYVDLLAVGLDGRPERLVVPAPGDDIGPTWSPDGLFIAYLNKSGDRSQVMVAAADGSDPHPISDVGDWFNPQWSPDARHVLAVDGRTGGGQPIVAILDPLGKEPAVSFALPDVSGFGRADLPSWQRRAR
jgi:Tol biopolymer transport system component